MSKEFEILLERYWELAYLEGKSGVSQGDKANVVLHALKALAEQPAQQEPESECNPQDLCAGCRCKYAAQPAEQPAQQEPVAWIWKYANGEEEVVFVSPRHVDATHVDAPSTITPLYTSPQPAQRTWVGLADELRAGAEPMFFCGAKWAERILKEKNI